MEARINHVSLANGTIHYPDQSESIGDLQWVEHAKFQGVYLKHLIRGAETAGLFSSHIVKLDPGCALDAHSHAGQWELHEIIEGNGTCMLRGETLDYHLGKMAVIPQGTLHKVQAGKDGLTLLAKFFPALI